MTVLLPTSLNDALALLADDPSSLVLAGGTDLMVQINEGTRLELGSTSKLRTLVTYLQIVAELYAKPPGSPSQDDALSLWAAEYLKTATDRSLPRPGATSIDLTGKRVVLTGASSGIGECAAEQFARRLDERHQRLVRDAELLG